MKHILHFLHFLAVLMVVLSMPLSSCSGAPPSPVSSGNNNSQVVLQSESEGQEVLQEFALDNCDGKADISRVESRSSSIDVTVSSELAVKIGASAEVISTEVQATVGAALQIGGERETSIELKAPPGTNMFFQLAWIGKSQIGVVQNVKGSGIPIAFGAFTPTDVRIKSQVDIGCPETSTPVVPTAISVATAIPQPTTEISSETSAGTELSEGQFWRSGGVGLQLTGHYYDLSNQCAAFSFDMTNASNQDLIVTILPEQFTAVDNTGYTWKTHALSDTNYCYMDSGLPNTGQLTIEVPSGKSNTGGNNQWIISFVGPIADPKVSSLKIIVNGLSRFQDATWVINFR